MSIFTPTIYNEPSFSGLFRLLDDFDSYRAASCPNPVPNPSSNNNSNNGSSVQRHQQAGIRNHHLPTLHPKFDLEETETAYHLHGDLPGIAKDQIHIEFTDPHTLTVRGKVERSYTKTSPTVDGVTDGTKTSAILNADGNDKTTTSSTEITTTSNDNEKQISSSSPSSTIRAFKPRYWIAERSVGEFSRSFNLSGPVAASGRSSEEIDHDGVKASLNNGVLEIIVPKVKRDDEKKTRRRIAIE